MTQKANAKVMMASCRRLDEASGEFDANQPNAQLTVASDTAMIQNGADRQGDSCMGKGETSQTSSHSAVEPPDGAKALKAVKCYSCGRLGHMKRECRYPRAKTEQRSESSSRGKGRGKGKGPVSRTTQHKAMVSRFTPKVAEVQKTSRSFFVVDSGATSHFYTAGRCDSPGG